MPSNNTREEITSRMDTPDSRLATEDLYTRPAISNTGSVSDEETKKNSQPETAEGKEKTGEEPDATSGSIPKDVSPPSTEDKKQEDPPFILYKSGEEFRHSVSQLAIWVHALLLPVYGREVTSTAPWCSRWWEHMEAVAQLYGLWMAWQQLTNAEAPLNGPASWHRDFLAPVMNSLRDPSGPFAGCKPGQHRAKQPPPVENS